ncbi:MAG: YceH family protein [Planctomycetota bacterium]
MNLPEEESQTVTPLSASARRVLGVLVEKAKTTPDNYPLTLAAIITASNQKSNRSPKMDLDEDDVLLALDELRNLGAVREVQGSGRAVKYRHAAYEWMDIDGPGSAVITELLLRGPQTVGEIRTRASRMHALPDLETVKSVIDGLVEKQLVEALTPPGRGQLFTHSLYPPQERQYLLEKINKDAPAAPSSQTPNAAKSVVDQLLSRLDAVSERIESLEKRIATLEDSDD